jgi:hypothetical protein
VTIRGREDICLSAVPQPPLGLPTRASDRFELRAPAVGNSPFGRVLAFSTGVVPVNHGCAIRVSFDISAKLGVFSFYDATDGGIWFGFSSAKLPSTGWRLIVIAEGAKG